MKIKKNDQVLVIAGKDAGKIAKVLVAMPKQNKVVVDGVNVQKKHKKARSAQEVSAIQNQSGPIDASNVLVICPVCGKATRVGYVIVDGKKVRACKKCGASLDVKVEKKEVAKKATTKKASTKKATEEVATEAAPKKTRTKKAETAPAVEEVAEVKKPTTRKKAVKEVTEDAEA